MKKKRLIKKVKKLKRKLKTKADTLLLKDQVDMILNELVVLHNIKVDKK
jgi:hypothetical protein